MTYECHLNQLDLFSRKNVILSVTHTTTQELSPLSSIENAKYLEFLSFGYDSSYRDVSNIYMHLKVRLMKNATEAHAAESKQTLAANTMNSLFSGVNVYYNNKNILSQDSSMANHVSYIQNLCNYDAASAGIHLSNVPFLPDEPNAFENQSPAAAGATNPKNDNYDKRVKMFNGSKEVNLYGRLNLNVSDRLLIPQVDLKIILEFGRQDVFILADKSEDTSVLRILEASLYIPHYHLNNDLLLSHEMLLKNNPIVYPFVRTTIKNFTYTSGLSVINLENAFVGEIPRKVLLCMLTTEAFLGAKNYNCYNYRHFDCTSMSCSVNGELVDIPLKFDFKSPNKIQSSRGYANLLQVLNYHKTGQTHGISKELYDGGAFINGFQLIPELDATCSSLSRDGIVKFNLTFATPLEKSITVLVYGEFESEIMVDEYRNIYLKN